MKRILLAAALLVGANAMAQNAASDYSMQGDVKQNFSLNASGTEPTDTVFDWFDEDYMGLGLSLTTYSWVDAQDNSQGYIFGTNTIGGDGYMVQGFILEEPYSVVGMQVWLSALYDNEYVDSSSHVKVGIFDLNDNGGSLMPSANPVVEDEIPFYSINAFPGATMDSASFFVMFNESRWMTADYAVGINFDPLLDGSVEIITDTLGNADTTVIVMDSMAVVTTTLGEGGGYCYNWVERNGAFTPWCERLESIEIDLNLALFPIIEQHVSIEEAAFFSGLKAEVYPNPTSDIANVKFEIETSSDNVSLEVFALNGQKVISKGLGSRNSGVLYTETIDVSNLASGSYIYALVSGSNRVTQKLIIE